jgi:hypothetical protein
MNAAVLWASEQLQLQLQLDLNQLQLQSDLLQLQLQLKAVSAIRLPPAGGTKAEYRKALSRSRRAAVALALQYRSPQLTTKHIRSPIGGVSAVLLGYVVRLKLDMACLQLQLH